MREDSCYAAMDCSGVVLPRRAGVALAAMSNGISEGSREGIKRLQKMLEDWGYDVQTAGNLYEEGFAFAGRGRERAECLMECYSRGDVEAIFDVSGGDLANEVLPYLDYSVIGDSRTVLWGYSDLTAVLNAIYAVTGKPSVLYQVRHLAQEMEGMPQRRQEVREALAGEDYSLFHFDGEFLQGSRMEGVLVGGNIRCLLKLAGTKYFPDVEGKVLFLESRSGDVSRMAAFLSQLQQMGVFQRAAGVLLGTFTEMEREGMAPGIGTMVQWYVPESLPVAKTGEVGHSALSRALVIGGQLSMERRL